MFQADASVPENLHVYMFTHHNSLSPKWQERGSRNVVQIFLSRPGVPQPPSVSSCTCWSLFMVLRAAECKQWWFWHRRPALGVSPTTGGHRRPPSICRCSVPHNLQLVQVPSVGIFAKRITENRVLKYFTISCKAELLKSLLVLG